jgi:phospho-N-acetylmuramoyl-pentapeptide-transferase
MYDLALGFTPAFLFVMVFGGPFIKRLRAIGAKQTISTDAPSRHLSKQGTPTMGGLLILGGLLFACLFPLYQAPEQRSMLGLLLLTIGYGLIGFADDLLIALRGKNLGLRAREKMALQFLLAICFIFWLHANEDPGFTTAIHFGTSYQYDLGWLYYPLGVLLIVGFSNALNFTDGLDGLASGISSLIAGALALIFLLLPGVGHYNDWLPIFGMAVAGACAAFLWYNANPAKVFMGDTGSLALGAALSGMALLGKEEITFLLFAIVPLAEIVSVMIQVTVFKYRTRTKGLEYAKSHRVFKRTPLHHHFEELGVDESTIVWRFILSTLLSIGVTVLITQGR